MLNTDHGAIIVEAARQWVGTPYAHQGRIIGKRVDCIGLIMQVGLELGYITVTEEDYAPFKGYSRQPNPRHMGKAVTKHLRRLECATFDLPPDGAIGWFEWRTDMPMHLGFIGSHRERKTIIHAYHSAERCVEHGFTDEWRERVNSWWAFPGTLGTVA